MSDRRNRWCGHLAAEKLEIAEETTRRKRTVLNFYIVRELTRVMNGHLNRSGNSLKLLLPVVERGQ